MKHIEDVLAQHAKNLQRWGEQLGLNRHAWLSLIAEEAGEAAKEANMIAFGPLKGNAGRYRAELVDLAAVVLGAIHAHDAADAKEAML